MTRDDWKRDLRRVDEIAIKTGEAVQNLNEQGKRPPPMCGKWCGGSGTGQTLIRIDSTDLSASRPILKTMNYWSVGISR